MVRASAKSRCALERLSLIYYPFQSVLTLHAVDPGQWQVSLLLPLYSLQ